RDLVPLEEGAERRDVLRAQLLDLSRPFAGLRGDRLGNLGEGRRALLLEPAQDLPRAAEPDLRLGILRIARRDAQDLERARERLLRLRGRHPLAPREGFGGPRRGGLVAARVETAEEEERPARLL